MSPELEKWFNEQIAIQNDAQYEARKTLGVPKWDDWSYRTAIKEALAEACAAVRRLG